MAFKLSNRSLGKLEGVHPDMVETVKMNSKHLLQDSGYSHAVDLVAYDGSDVVWELNVYDDIADAMKAAAKEVGCAIKWGAAWSVGNIVDYGGTMEEAMNEYIDLRRSEGRRPFIDGPHFELMV